jgi:TM2 domain-containing membrane protein YozV
MIICQKCGTENQIDLNFCGKCGNNLTGKIVPASSNKTWFTTFWLCSYGGIFGIHRFYTGKIGTGILQLFSLGVFGIWTFIDWITIISNNFKDKDGNKIIRKPGEGKKALIIILAIIFIPLIIGILISSLSGGSENKGNTNVSTPSNQTVAAPAVSAYFIGDTLKSNRINLIVTGVERKTQIGEDGSKKPSEGAIFVAVRYKYKNVSTEAIGMFSHPSINLVDPSGNKYDADADASTEFSDQIQDNEKIISDLNPGITVRASYVFEVSQELFNTSSWHLTVEFDDNTFKVGIGK